MNSALGGVKRGKNRAIQLIDKSEKIIADKP
jgi:hypothetical protein